MCTDRPSQLPPPAPCEPAARSGRLSPPTCARPPAQRLSRPTYRPHLWGQVRAGGQHAARPSPALYAGPSSRTQPSRPPDTQIWAPVQHFTQRDRFHRPLRPQITQPFYFRSRCEYDLLLKRLWAMRLIVLLRVCPDGVPVRAVSIRNEYCARLVRRASVCIQSHMPLHGDTEDSRHHAPV